MRIQNAIIKLRRTVIIVLWSVGVRVINVQDFLEGWGNMISITKVVARNFVMDFVARVQNFFGMDLTSYEQMVQKGISQVKEELQQKNIKLKWYRYEITQLTNGAIVIMFYGDEK